MITKILFLNFYIYCYHQYQFKYIFYFITKNFILFILFQSLFFLILCHIYLAVYLAKKIILNAISPNKTYEGLLAGILFTLLITFFVNNLLSLYNFFNFIIYTTIFIFSAFLGDIFESYFKRKANIKDSGKLIPGHGGFFDRFDSFIMSVIPLTLLNFYGL